MNILTIWNHLQNARAAAIPVVEAAAAAYDKTKPAVQQQDALVHMERHNCVMSGLNAAISYAEQIMGSSATSAAKSALETERSAAAQEAAATAKLSA